MYYCYNRSVHSLRPPGQPTTNGPKEYTHTHTEYHQVGVKRTSLLIIPLWFLPGLARPPTHTAALLLSLSPALSQLSPAIKTERKVLRHSLLLLRSSCDWFQNNPGNIRFFDSFVQGAYRKRCDVIPTYILRSIYYVCMMGCVLLNGVVVIIVQHHQQKSQNNSFGWACCRRSCEVLWGFDATLTT